MENQQQFRSDQDQQNQQKIQKLEAVASHYTQAANYLRRNQEEACANCIQNGQEAAKAIWQIINKSFTGPNTQ